MNLLERAVLATLPAIPRPLMRRLSARYIAGETIEEALAKLESLQGRGFPGVLDILGEDHGFHLDIFGHLLADIRDRPMTLTPGRKLAPVDVPWVAAMFEGVVPPWHREGQQDEDGTTKADNWYLNYA